MKKNLMRNLLYVFAFAMLFSCSSSGNNNDVLMYTTDATLGLSRVNLNTISDKIPVEKILKEKKDLQNDHKLFLQLVSKPKESGIDIDHPLYFIVDQGKSTNEPDIKAFFWIDDKEK